MLQADGMVAVRDMLLRMEMWHIHHGEAEAQVTFASEA